MGHYFYPEERGRSTATSIRLRNEIMRSVQRPGWCVVLQLAYGVGDPAPHRGAVVIVLGRELIGARGAFVERLITCIA
jgi:hypothetical protein